MTIDQAQLLVREFNRRAGIKDHLKPSPEEFPPFEDKGPDSLESDLSLYLTAAAVTAKEMSKHEPRYMPLALIVEEAAETVEAHLRSDLAAYADGLADLLYVLLGAACERGIRMQPIFREVHRANMGKIEGGERHPETGKFMKPEGWRPPDIRALIEAQKGNNSS